MLRKRLWLWGLALLLVLSLALVSLDYQRFLHTPLAVPATAGRIELPPGTGLHQLAQQLGLGLRGYYLQIYARLHGQAHRLQAGEYAITAATTPQQLLEQIVAGRVIQYPLTIVEGWTFRQLRDAITAHPQLTQTLSALSDAEIMARLGRVGDNAEGWFLPDTYHFPKGFTDLAFLRRALQAMEQQLTALWAQRSADLPLDHPYQALILASIIEKESGLAAERAEIAGVFIRRLRLGMRLQTDPTVIYGLGTAFDGNLRRRDLQTDTPYNTYTRHGLPPTPIALPSRSALAAAVQPAPGNTLYFVANGQGGHTFSTTLAQHQQAVRQYQQRNSD